MKETIKKRIILGIVIVVCLLILVQEISLRPSESNEEPNLSLIEPGTASQDQLTIGGKTNGETQSDAVPAAQDPSKTDEDTVYSMSDTDLMFKGIGVKVDGLLISEGDALTQPQAGHVFVVIELTVTNDKSEIADVDPLHFTLSNASGQIVDVSLVPLFTSLKLDRLKLEPDASVQGVVIFEVSQSDTSGILRYAPSILERDEVLKIKLNYPNE